MAHKPVLTPGMTNEELLEWAKEEMRLHPNGNPNARRTDAPLRDDVVKPAPKDKPPEPAL